jgi:hypothetical protein
MTSETKLWAMLIPGPDEVWAMPSKEAAEAAANRHNKAIEAPGLAATWGDIPLSALQATVIEWPYDAESHAEALVSGEAEVLSSNELGIPDSAAAALGLPLNGPLQWPVLRSAASGG